MNYLTALGLIVAGVILGFALRAILNIAKQADFEDREYSLKMENKIIAIEDKPKEQKDLEQEDKE